jgi:hypothetical protein
MLFVDGGNNKVGIGTGTPSTNFVVSNSGAEGIEFIAGSTNFIQSYNRNGSAYLPFKIDASSISLAPTASSEVVINDSGLDADFRVESDTNTHALFVEGSTSNVMVGKSSSSVGTVGTLIAPMQTKITNNAATPSLTTNQLGWGGATIDFLYTGARKGYISTSSTAVAYVTSSDQRLKENVADADDAGSKIDAIQVRKFDWKVDGSHQDYGMVAQELQTVAPEAVSGDADSEEMMGVDYSKLVPMLIKEIQSLRQRVAQLEE